MTAAELERLAILSEELGEVQQVIGKIIRHGYASHNPFDKNETTNRKLLEKELGDVLFAATMMVEKDDISQSAIQDFSKQKRHKIREYLRHNEV